MIGRAGAAVTLLPWLLAGCAAAGRGDLPDPFREVAVLLEVTDRHGRTYPATRYLNNDASRLCYTFRVPGRWRAGGESGLLRSPDGQALVDVLVWSARDLEPFEGGTLMESAAQQTAAVYERQLGRPLDRIDFAPFEAARPGAKKWRAWWVAEVAGRPVIGEASKVFVPIGLGWIAQVTVEGTHDDDEVTREVLKTLDMTIHPECYRPYMRRAFPTPGTAP